MKWALVNGSDIVENIIVYHAESGYSPPEGSRLVQIDDSINIGDSIHSTSFKDSEL